MTRNHWRQRQALAVDAGKMVDGMAETVFTRGMEATRETTTMNPLDSVITAGDRRDIAAASGLELSDEVHTVAEAIAALCTIGYGGHYDEALPDEDDALCAIAEAIEVEVSVIADARADLAERLRLAHELAVFAWQRAVR